MQIPMRLILAMPCSLADEIDDVVHVTVDMVVDGQEAILAGRIAPVDHIEVDALLRKFFDHAPLRLQIEHGLPVDQGIDHQQRRLERGLRFRGRVMLQLYPVLLIDDFVRGRGNIGFQGAQQDVGGLFSRVLGLVGFLSEMLQDQVNGDLRLSVIG